MRCCKFVLTLIMKHRIYLLFVFCFLFQMFSFAQQNRFLYIQTESRQPFYVNFNNNILSSSASGYLIIPKLQEGTYQLTIGFPKNEWPRQIISYRLGKNDEGVLLKNFGEQGWGFSNLQNGETTMSAINKATPAVAGDEDSDSFTQTLSEVVNTPDLKIKAKVEESVPVVVAKVQEPVPASTKQGPDVVRLSEATNDQGRELIYLSAGDTISIFIPATLVKSAPPETKKIDSAIVVTSKPVEETPVVTQPKEVEKTSATEQTNQQNANKSVIPESEVKEVIKPAGIMVNSDCKGFAGDEDFMKLRKKMASEESEVKMVVVAKKAFKSKCYSTSQIKNLSVLFLNDSGRFQFFESAYPFVSDSNNFNGLQAQLNDPYYITRFESLIRR